VVGGALFGPTIPPIGPGETASAVFSLDALAATSRYFSYASMIIPSNDAFIANGNPTAFRILADDGMYLGIQALKGPPGAEVYGIPRRKKAKC
jgi:hypothetical protein